MHTNPLNNLSPRHSQLPPMTPRLYNFTTLEDAIFDTSSHNSPVHNVWQSTKTYLTTPPPMEFNDIPLTSVDSLFIQTPECFVNFIPHVAYTLYKFRNFSFE